MSSKKQSPVLPRRVLKAKWRKIKNVMRMTAYDLWDERQRTVSDHMVWKDQDFYVAALEKYGLALPGAPEIRNYFLQSCLRGLDALDGDVAECGTRGGKSSLYMLMASEKKRPFWLFDSFEGLSDPNPARDGMTSVMDKTGKKRIFNVDFEEIKERFAPYDNVTLMRGWIPERFNEVADRTFCFVHVDVDLYEPTLDSFRFFYERMIPGGMMVCDDYGSSFFPGARVAMDEFFADKPEAPIELPQGQAFIVKQ